MIEKEHMKQAFDKSVEQLVKEGNLEGLAIKYTDLTFDFEYVKSLNEDISTRYAEMLACYPTPQELNWLIELITSEQHGNIKIEMKNYNQKERTQKLKKFLSALVELEKQNINKVPENYSLPPEGEQ